MRLRVDEAMTATFFGSQVHPVLATFAIVEHAEYASRQAIMPFLDRDEDAVGVSVSIDHRSPATVGTIVEVEACVVSVVDASITCNFSVRSGDRLIATGTSVQRMVDRRRFRARIESLRNNHDSFSNDRHSA